MGMLKRIEGKSWTGPFTADQQEHALDALEHGRVVYFPELSFTLHGDEVRFLSPEWSAGRAKNISLDLNSGRIKGTRLKGPDAGRLSAMMARYSGASKALIEQLLPSYRNHLEQGRTSFRPVEVVGRASSPRNDDRRLHTDAFPSRPTRGARILRVFTNVNPAASPRIWRLGEPFEDLARRFCPKLSPPLIGSASLLVVLRITKGRRTAYDHLMLQLHDRTKQDRHYQEEAPQAEVAFPAGSTWIVFTDQVLHAALGGQHLFEQTFHLPVSAQRWPDLSPLRVLERLTKRNLIS